MVLIFMQPVDDEESTKAGTTLKDMDKCVFDLTKNSARLKPAAFGSRGCNMNEVNFHSFTGKGACGCWEITQNRKYLWGCYFYCMCDCSTIKEIHKYNGSIPMIY